MNQLSSKTQCLPPASLMVFCTTLLMVLLPTPTCNATRTFIGVNATFEGKTIVDEQWYISPTSIITFAPGSTIIFPGGHWQYAYFLVSGNLHLAGNQSHPIIIEEKMAVTCNEHSPFVTTPRVTFEHVYLQRGFFVPHGMNTFRMCANGIFTMTDSVSKGVSFLHDGAAFPAFDHPVSVLLQRNTFVGNNCPDHSYGLLVGYACSALYIPSANVSSIKVLENLFLEYTGPVIAMQNANPNVVEVRGNTFGAVGVKSIVTVDGGLLNVSGNYWGVTNPTDIEAMHIGSGVQSYEPVIATATEAIGNKFECWNKVQCNGRALRVQGNRYDGCSCVCYEEHNGTACDVCADDLYSFPACAPRITAYHPPVLNGERSWTRCSPIDNNTLCQYVLYIHNEEGLDTNSSSAFNITVWCPDTIPRRRCTAVVGSAFTRQWDGLVNVSGVGRWSFDPNDDLNCRDVYFEDLEENNDSVQFTSTTSTLDHVDVPFRATFSGLESLFSFESCDAPLTAPAPETTTPATTNAPQDTTLPPTSSPVTTLLTTEVPTSTLEPTTESPATTTGVPPTTAPVTGSAPSTTDAPPVATTVVPTAVPPSTVLCPVITCAPCPTDAPPVETPELTPPPTTAEPTTLAPTVAPTFAPTLVPETATPEPLTPEPQTPQPTTPEPTPQPTPAPFVRPLKTADVYLIANNETVRFSFSSISHDISQLVHCSDDSVDADAFDMRLSTADLLVVRALPQNVGVHELCEPNRLTPIVVLTVTILPSPAPSPSYFLSAGAVVGDRFRFSVQLPVDDGEAEFPSVSNEAGFSLLLRQGSTCQGNHDSVVRDGIHPPFMAPLSPSMSSTINSHLDPGVYVVCGRLVGDVNNPFNTTESKYPVLLAKLVIVNATLEGQTTPLTTPQTITLPVNDETYAHRLLLGFADSPTVGSLPDSFAFDEESKDIQFHLSTDVASENADENTCQNSPEPLVSGAATGVSGADNRWHLTHLTAASIPSASIASFARQRIICMCFTHSTLPPHACFGRFDTGLRLNPVSVDRFASSNVTAQTEVVASFSGRVRDIAISGRGFLHAEKWGLSLSTKHDWDCTTALVGKHLVELPMIVDSAEAARVRLPPTAPQTLVTLCISFKTKDSSAVNFAIPVPFIVEILPFSSIEHSRSDAHQQQQVVSLSNVVRWVPLHVHDSELNEELLLTRYEFYAFENSQERGSEDGNTEAPANNCLRAPLTYKLPLELRSNENNASKMEPWLKLDSGSMGEGKYTICCSWAPTVNAALLSRQSVDDVLPNRQGSSGTPQSVAANSGVEFVVVSVSVEAGGDTTDATGSGSTLASVAGQPLKLSLDSSLLDEVDVFVSITDQPTCATATLSKMSSCEGSSGSVTIDTPEEETSENLKFCIAVSSKADGPFSAKDVRPTPTSLELTVTMPTDFSVITPLPPTTITSDGELAVQPVLSLRNGTSNSTFVNMPDGMLVQAQWISVFPFEKRESETFQLEVSASDTSIDFSKSKKPITLGNARHGYHYVLEFYTVESDIQMAPLNSTIVKVGPCKADIALALSYTSECRQCPEDAICDGTVSLRVKGYKWRANNETLKFYSCDLPYMDRSCTPNTTLGACEEGHTGVRCSVCKQNYAKSFSACVACDHPAVNWTFVVLMFAGFALLSLVLIMSTLRCKKSDQFPTFIKVFINHLVITSNMEHTQKIPRVLAQLFQIQRQASRPSPAFASFDCALGVNWYEKMIGMIAMPIGLAILLAIVLLLVWLIKGGRKVQLEMETDDKASLDFTHLSEDLKCVAKELATEEHSKESESEGANVTAYETLVVSSPPLQSTTISPAQEQLEFSANNQSAPPEASCNPLSPLDRSRLTVDHDSIVLEDLEDGDLSIATPITSFTPVGSGSQTPTTKQRQSLAQQEFNGLSVSNQSAPDSSTNNVDIPKGEQQQQFIPIPPILQTGGAVNLSHLPPPTGGDNDLQGNDAEAQEEHPHFIDDEADATHAPLRRVDSEKVEIGAVHSVVKSSSYKHIYIICMIVLLFLTYPSVVQWCANVLKCEHIDFGRRETDGQHKPDIRSVFFYDRSKECSSSQHQQMVTIGVTFFVFYGFGTPAFALFSFRLMRRRPPSGIGNAEASRMFTFLIAGYRKQVWWWEGVLLLRKGLLIVTFAFIADNYLQSMVAFWIVLLSLVAQVTVQPYEYETVDSMERTSLVCMCVSLNLALLYQYVGFESSQDETITILAYMLTVTIALLNLGVMVYMIAIIAQEAKIKLQRLIVEKKEWIQENLPKRLARFLLNHEYKGPKFIEIDDGNGNKVRVELEDLSEEERAEILNEVDESGSDWSDESLVLDDDDNRLLELEDHEVDALEAEVEDPGEQEKRGGKARVNKKVNNRVMLTTEHNRIVEEKDEQVNWLESLVQDVQDETSIARDKVALLESQISEFSDMATGLHEKVFERGTKIASLENMVMSLKHELLSLELKYVAATDQTEELMRSVKRHEDEAESVKIEKERLQLQRQLLEEERLAADYEMNEVMAREREERDHFRETMEQRKQEREEQRQVVHQSSPLSNLRSDVTVWVPSLHRKKKDAPRRKKGEFSDEFMARNAKWSKH